MHDYEYHAIRNSAGLIDISPLYKYEVRGKDALRLVNRVITRDASRCAVGQALYACLCEDDGAVIQDGTLFRLADDHFRFQLADPSLRWLKLNATGWTCQSRMFQDGRGAGASGTAFPQILERVLDADLGQLRFFRLTSAKIDKVAAVVSRTGYTGDRLRAVVRRGARRRNLGPVDRSR
jgi:aminomethyltransferase